MVTNTKLFSKLLAAEQYFFPSPRYRRIVEEAVELFESGQLIECKRKLDKLPTRSALLSKLVEKLKGKSVYKTLRKIEEGKADNNLVTAKGLSSLLTHTLIEQEKHPEYRMLVPVLIEKLNEVVYSAI